MTIRYVVACLFIAVPLRAQSVDSAEFARRVAAYPRISLEQAERALRESLRDPESARVSQMVQSNAHPSGVPVVCGVVNAKNAYGGYAGDSPFIVSGAGVVVRRSDNARGFDRMWQSSCTRPVSP